MSARTGWFFALLFVLALVGAGALFALDGAAAPDEQAALALAAANGLLARGEGALAVEAYEQLAGQGIADAALFYNRGLAYAQLGDWGSALHSLDSAAALAPRDVEVLAAREEVRAQLLAAGGMPVLAGDIPGTAGALARLSRPWVTLDELSATALALWIGLAALLLALIYAPAGTRRRGLLLAGAAVLGVVLIAAVLLLGARAVVELQGSFPLPG